MLEQKIWAEKYRPTTVKECFLPGDVRKELESYIKSKEVPTLLFSGLPGIGKTTAAKALLNDIGAEYVVINGSLHGNIDTLRNDIMQFASTISLNGEKKYVIIDEADYLTGATQAALRGFIDEYSKNCGFIFTCNFRNKIIGAIANSRLASIDLGFSGHEKAELAKMLYKKMLEILALESIKIESAALQKFIVDHLKISTDIRKLLVLAQQIATQGEFTAATVASNSLSERFDLLNAALKRKNFTEVRTWIGENADIEPSRIFRHLYDNVKGIVRPALLPSLAIILSDAQAKQAVVADSEINIAAACAQIMAECIE